MKHSKYQEAVFAFVRGEPFYRDDSDQELAWDAPLPDDWAIDFMGKRHAVVEAVAGSGKTTTIVKALDFLAVPEAAPLTSLQLVAAMKDREAFESITLTKARATVKQPRVLFTAFNKHIAEELQRRVPRYVTASTLNSVGWGICRANVPKVRLDRYKDENILRTFLNTDDEDQRKTYYKVKSPLTKLVALFKALLVADPDARFNEVAGKYDVTVPEVEDFDFKLTALNVWAKSVRHVNDMSFDDQVFQPVYQGWEIPTFDWVFTDEVQDFNAVKIELLKRLGRKGRIVAVGDRRQSIYGFTGSLPDAIPTLISELDAVSLPLSICYRCPDAVIEEAQKIVPHMEKPVPNPKGRGIVDTITTPEFVSGVRDGDFVLCRTTAPLVRRCLQLIGMQRKAIVKGRDLGQGLLDLLEQLAPDVTMPVWEFLEKLAQHRAVQLEKLSKSNRETEAQALEDKCDTLDVLALGCDRTIDIAKRIETVFSDEECSGVNLMTGHRCKGLEANRIFILRPDLCPHPKSKQDWQIEQEYNLKMVMITRSMAELYFVEKERDEK